MEYLHNLPFTITVTILSKLVTTAHLNPYCSYDDQDFTTTIIYVASVSSCGIRFI